MTQYKVIVTNRKNGKKHYYNAIAKNQTHAIELIRRVHSTRLPKFGKYEAK